MTLHFAYGSNMSRALMGARCRGAEAVGIAVLSGWRFVINPEGFGSIAPRPGGRVHGVLWRLSARDLAAINAYESVDSGLYLRRRLPVRCGDVQAMALGWWRLIAAGRPARAAIASTSATARPMSLRCPAASVLRYCPRLSAPKASARWRRSAAMSRESSGPSCRSQPDYEQPARTNFRIHAAVLCRSRLASPRGRDRRGW